MTGADHQSRHLLGSGSEGRIYSIASPLPPIANKKALTLANQGFLFGAGEMNRTPDLLITNFLRRFNQNHTEAATNVSHCRR